MDLGWIQFTCTIFSAATDTEKGHLLEWGCLLNKGAYLVGASLNRNIWRGPHIREGALIGRRALNRIITVLNRFTENILGFIYFKLIFWFICTTLTCRTFSIHLYTLGVLCLRSASTIHDQYLACVTKREFLLTIPLQYQADKWRELRKLSIRVLLVDPKPNSPEKHQTNGMADSKENYRYK